MNKREEGTYTTIVHCLIKPDFQAIQTTNMKANIKPKHKDVSF